VALDAFGDGYDGATPTVVVLSIAMLLATAIGPADVVLLMAGRSGTSTANAAAALATDVVLIFVLTPTYGITGAAWAWAAAIAVRNVLPALQVRRSLGITTFGPQAATVAATIAVPVVVVAPLVRLGIDADRPEAVLLLAAALVVAAAGLWRTRDRTGIASLLEVVRRRDTAAASTAPATDPMSSGHG
jgi:O-antigen/teichoic acid export membrane protein